MHGGGARMHRPTHLFFPLRLAISLSSPTNPASPGNQLRFELGGNRPAIIVRMDLAGDLARGLLFPSRICV
jgi:hypothetical protein